MGSESDELNVFFVPFLAPGHMIPMVDVARLFAARGVTVTIVTTPSNASLFQKSIDHDTNLGHKISIRVVQFPHAEFGLPVGIESLNMTNSLDMTSKLFCAIGTLQQPLEQVLYDMKPDCIVTDMFYPWSIDVARQLGIPRLIFNGSSFVAQCAEHIVRQHKPYESMESDIETFVLPGLPHNIKMTKLQIDEWIRIPDEFTHIMNVVREAEMKSYGAIINSFYELEHDYEELYKTVIGIKAWSIGPVSQAVNRDAADKARRGNQSAVEEYECITWLNSKEHNSVLYISFGSMTKFPAAQLLEIAAGLEASGKQFMWVVHKIQYDEEWLPEGFEKRMSKSKNGFIIRGWSPQLLILDHPAIGGFVTHCGWNSILEGVNAGLPLITWPLFAEQFYNEKLVTHVLKIGVPIGVTTWFNSMFEEVKELVKRDKVEEAVTLVMSGGQEAVEMRKRVGELRTAAKKAVESGGSSDTNLTTLINELKAVKYGRAR